MKRKRPILRVVTNSERDNFACRRLWFFRSVEGLTTSLSPAPLREGSLVAQGIEYWAKAGSTAAIDEIDRAVLSPWLERRIEWAKENDGKLVDMGEQIREDTEIYAEAKSMLRGYVQHWSSDAEEWETVAVEAQVCRWLVDPRRPAKDGGPRPIFDSVVIARDADGRPTKRRRRRWSYGGKIDRLARHRQSGSYWLFETKTTKETNLDKFCRKLHFDPQIRGYAWALARPVHGYTDPVLEAVREDDETGEILRGFRVEGVVYDVLRKVTVEIPTLIKSGQRLVKASTITTDYDTYLEAILAHGFNPDDEEYRSQLDALRESRHYHRESYSFSDREIEDFGRDVAWTALDMIAEERRSYHPRSTRICSGFNRGCPAGFESICMEDGPMARRSYLRATVRHPELAGDLAEPISVNARAAQTGKVAGDDESAEPDPFGVAADGEVCTVDLGAADAAEDDDHDDTTSDDFEDLFGPGADDDAAE